MIELQSITKIYPAFGGDRVVLDRISTVFPAKTSVGILGPNGAGKSTLLRVIGGAELPDEGKVIRHGRVSWPIGFAGGFHGSLSGRENCHFVARIYGADIDETAAFAEAFADIGTYFDMPMKIYSSGMRARLAFGLSMAIDFDVYLVDEVTGVGDTTFQERCRLAFEERKSHSSVIMVSHSTDTLRDHCSRFAVLRDGQLFFYDDFSEAVREYEVASA